ncbi:MAG: FlgD immunoglobulin-like domain containing protein [Smithella sp.]
MKSHILLLIIALILLFKTDSINAGTWTYYFDGNDINDLCIKEDFIYCATTGGLIIWNRSNGIYEQKLFWEQKGCCQYQRSRFTKIAMGNNNFVWCCNTTGNSSELVLFCNGSWIVYSPELTHIQGTIEALEVDQSNILWVSTQTGIISFDGISWKTYLKDSSGASLIRLLAVDNNNVKWFKTSKGLTSYNDTTWNAYAEEDGLPNVQINAIAVSSDNIKWFALADKSIYRYDDIAFKKYGSLEIPASSLAVDRNNNVWCCTSSGLFVNNGKSWSKYIPENSGLPDEWVKTVVIDDDNVAWLATTAREQSTGNGLSRFDGSGWETWFINGPKSYLVHDIAVDRNNVMWFCTATKGVSSFDGTNWKTYTKDNELVDNNIYRVVVDNNNIKWFSTLAGKGILSFDGISWKTYSTENCGIHDNFISSMSVDQENVKWFASGAVSSYDGVSWKNYRDDSAGHQIHEPVSVDLKNNKWFGTKDGVVRFNGTSWLYYPIPDLKINDQITEIAVDNNGVMWFNTHNSGVFSFDGSQWKNYMRPPTDRYLKGKMVIDRYGVLWFIYNAYDNSGITGAGLASFDGSTWKFHRDDSWLLYAAERSVVIDHNNVKWIVTDSGFASYDGIHEDTISDVDKHHNHVFPITLQNSPNPFNISTTIMFSLSDIGFTTLTVYNIQGQKIKELITKTLTPGTHSVVWYGDDDDGNPVSSGIYISHLKMRNYSMVGRMVMIK